ncbi:MAG: hypothetical protein MHM6MM_000193 [Cercozoa sp. M6MM]
MGRRTQRLPEVSSERRGADFASMVSEAMEEVKARACAVDFAEALETMLVYMHNVIKAPLDARFRKIRIANINYQERLGHIEDGEALLRAIGFEVLGEKEFLVLPEDVHRDDQSALKQCVELVKQQLEEVRKEFADEVCEPNNKEWVSVRAAASLGEIGRRTYMEDSHSMQDCFNGDPKQALFCLYDGHGGRQTVDCVVRTLPLNLKHRLDKVSSEAEEEEAVKAAISDVFLHTDGQVRRRNIMQSGATAVTCLLRHETLFTANVGDSRAVLCRNGRAERLTRDHKPQDPEEAQRVTSVGGFIGRFQRVNGILAVSRALGDHMLKPAVSAEPHMTMTRLDAECEYVVLACDGIWDVMDDQDVIDFVDKRVAELVAGDGQQQQGKEEEKEEEQQQEAEQEEQHQEPEQQDEQEKEHEQQDAQHEQENEEEQQQKEEEQQQQQQEQEQQQQVSQSAATKTVTSRPSYSKAQLRPVLEQVCRDLIQTALDRRSLDNISVMIVYF